MPTQQITQEQFTGSSRTLVASVTLVSDQFMSVPDYLDLDAYDIYLDDDSLLEVR